MAERGRGALQRNIYFFRGITESAGQREKIKPKDVAAAVDAIFKSREPYLDIGNATELLAWNSSNATHTRIAFGAIRRRGLPQIEHKGKIRALEILEEEGLVDLSHIVIFDDGVVGQEFNQMGPRIGRFGEYLGRKYPVLGIVQFQMLFRKDVWDQMNKLGEVHLIRLRLEREYIPELYGAEEGLSALTAMADVAGSPEVELVFRRTKYSKQNLLGQPKQLIERFFKFAQDKPDGVSELDVRGVNQVTDRVETFDFLRNRLVGTRRVARETAHGKGVETEAMFNAIVAARSELEKDIAQSLVIGEQ